MHHGEITSVQRDVPSGFFIPALPVAAILRCAIKDGGTPECREEEGTKKGGHHNHGKSGSCWLKALDLGQPSV